jgi:hypothetical protein
VTIELFKRQREFFSIYVDDVLVEDNVDPVVISVMNTKYGGAGTIINPFALSNDG